VSDSKDLYDRFVGSLGNPLLKSDAFFFGTVTSVRPIKVQLDGDTAPAASTPVLLVPDPVVNSRVLCQLHGRQLFVVSVVQPGTMNRDQLGNTEHLDNLTDTHTWHQPLNANTSTARGYPVALAGLLEIFRGADGFVYQRYSTYNGSGVYFRSQYNGTWNGWIFLAKPTVYNLTGSISNFTLAGRITIEMGADGKRKAVYNARLTRAVSNYGTISTTSWVTLGTLVPAAAQFSTVFNPNYVVGWATSGSNTMPISVSLGHDSGTISLKGTAGLTTTINIGDFVSLYTVLSEA
jgi:hypothetical protein